MSTPSEPTPSGSQHFIPLCVPEIRGNEWRYVKECLDTGWVSSIGSFVTRFESELATRVGARHAVAVVNGTAALHLALQVAGVGPEDEVIVSTLTFIAPVNAIRYVGAWPVLIDAEPTYWQIDPEQVGAFLEKECIYSQGRLRNRETGRTVKALLPVHILGHPVDLAPLLEVARKYGLAVIEDATEGLGATYHGDMVGRLGDIGCFSFNGNKLITTGGGGMLVTNNAAYAERARYLSTQAKDDQVESIHHEIGYNYRLTNLLAAMGCAQLEQLDAYIETKRCIAERYRDALADLPGLTPMREASWARSVFWMYTVLVDEKKCVGDSRALLQHLAAKKIQTRPLWQPAHLNKPHRGLRRGNHSVSEELYRTAISLPCSVGLTEEDQRSVISVLRDWTR